MNTTYSIIKNTINFFFSKRISDVVYNNLLVSFQRFKDSLSQSLNLNKCYKI